jgi:cytochrome d ubiquinol oxidase subunit II
MLLETIWFFLWGLLWAVFFVTDGFDFGVGTLLPFLAKDEREKRTLINAIGPLWDGNEVWLLTAGGATFAAFPRVYAVMFSSLYTPLMLILFSLILRGVAFEFRGRVDATRWRAVWDGCIFAGSALPALLFGVAFANIFAGLPIDGEGLFQGNLFSLLTPYGLAGGLLFVVLFLFHGSLWSSMKSEGDLQRRATAWAHRFWFALLATAVVFLIATAVFTPLYDNYLQWPVLFVVLLGTVAALVLAKLFLVRSRLFAAWLASAGTIIGCTFFGVIGLYPNMFPSNLDAAYSLTAHNSSSTPLTLTIMLVVVLIFIPIVLAYQLWAYRLFRGRVQTDDLVY